MAISWNRRRETKRKKWAKFYIWMDKIKIKDMCRIRGYIHWTNSVEADTLSRRPSKSNNPFSSLLLHWIPRKTGRDTELPPLVVWTSSKFHLTVKCPYTLLTAVLQPKSITLFLLLEFFNEKLKKNANILV